VEEGGKELWQKEGKRGIGRRFGRSKTNIVSKGSTAISPKKDMSGEGIKNSKGSGSRKGGEREVRFSNISLRNHPGEGGGGGGGWGLRCAVFQWNGAKKTPPEGSKYAPYRN